MRLDNLNVTTTSGRRFSGEETALLAALVSKRFGDEKAVAAAAWRRLLGNDCSDEDFAELASYGSSYVTYKTYPR